MNGFIQYLEEKYNIYCKLVENSVLVNTSIIDKLVPLEISYKSKSIQHRSKSNELRNNSFLSITDDKNDKLVRPHGIIPIITSVMTSSNSDESLNTRVVAPNLIESERSSPSTENA